MTFDTRVNIRKTRLYPPLNGSTGISMPAMGITVALYPLSSVKFGAEGGRITTTLTSLGA